MLTWLRRSRLRAVDFWIAAAGASLVVYQWAVARPLWLDEQMVAINIRERGFGELAGKLSLEQSAPYGWLVLERLAMLVGGTSERSMRIVPLLFGVATIGTAVWVGRRWLAPVAASLLVLLCSVGQWMTYSFVELKHYSADACLGLLLPALAAWAVETDRVVLWWIAAAFGQLFANGALFVTPLCAIAIVAVVFQDRGAAKALRAAAPGLIWVALFAANYLLILRPAHTSEFLQTYWQQQFPPSADGVAATCRWFVVRLASFAAKPGGTRLGLLLWVTAAAGFAAARERTRLLALMFATVPFAGFLLATLHFVPFFERLVLWVVPSLYVGVALVPDAGVRLKADTGRIVAIAVAAIIAADVTYVGLDDLNARPAATNHRLDDRSAVRWLAAREQPGDVWVTTHLALPAIWWYAPEVGLKVDTPIIEVGYVDAGPDCHADALAHAFGAAPRVLVFSGFHFDDVPKNFDDLLLDRLTALGQMTAYRGFEDVSRAAIFDRRLVSRRDLGEQVPGCLSARPARRW